MRLAKLLWVWAVSTASVLATSSRSRHHHNQEQHLNYDVSSKVPFSSRQSNHELRREPLGISDLGSNARSVTSSRPSDDSNTPGSSYYSQSSRGRKLDNSASGNLYYSLISNKKKEDKKKNKKKEDKKNKRRDHASRHHVGHDESPASVNMHLPAEEPKRTVSSQSSIRELSQNQNEILSTNTRKNNPQNQRKLHHSVMPSLAHPSVNSGSRSVIPTTAVPSPWVRLSRVPSTHNKGKTHHVRSPVVRYPYSTTFQSFDSFLNSLGTSFKLDEDPHSIRARSDNGGNSLSETDDSLDYSHAGTVEIDFSGAPESSQDIYETNALGIDVLEQDKATFLNMPERCCGSKVPLDPKNAVAIGGFSRVAAAGSIKVIEVPDKDTDLLPPSVVRDLRILVTGPRTVKMEWTAPGDDLDGGTVSRYVIRLSDTRYDLRESRFDQGVSFTELDLNDLLEASGSMQEAGSNVDVTFNVDDRVPTRLRPGQQYYVALRAFDDFNNTSPVSNVATFTLPILGKNYYVTTTTTTTTPPPTTTTTTTTPPPTTTTTTTLPPTTTTTTPSTTTTSTTTSTTSTTTMAPTTTIFSSSEEYTTTESEEIENQLVPMAIVEGRVVPEPVEETRRRKKGRKGRGKGRKRVRKGKKVKRTKKGRKTDSEEEEPLRTPSPETSFDTYNRYDTPGCHGDQGQMVTDGKLCDAISALLTVIDYFEQTREYKHVDYLSSIVVTLRNRAQPHWRGT